MVETNILDVLLDGTITRLELKTESMRVTIGREEPNRHFTIEKVDVLDQVHMEEALADLVDHLHEYCMCSIDVNCVDGARPH